MFCFSKSIDKRNLVYGVYDDEHKLLNTVEAVREKGFEIFDCFTPFPVHHLDTAMGIKRSKLSIAAFVSGATGFGLGLLLQFYMMVFDWPMNIGGKPTSYRMLPSMIPVVFECTILCTAFGLALLFFIRNKMGHGVNPDILNIRQTDDRLLIAFDSDKLNKFNSEELNSLLKENGAIEINKFSGKYANKN